MKKYKFKNAEDRAHYNKFWRGGLTIIINVPGKPRINFTGHFTEEQILKETEAYRPEGAKYKIRNTVPSDYFEYKKQNQVK